MGIVDTYSGPPAVFGNDALNGFKLALSDINKSGVLGSRITFVTPAEKFSPETGLSMARELAVGPLVAAGMWFFTHRTRMGNLARAAAVDHEMAALLGIDVNRVFAGAFLLFTP